MEMTPKNIFIAIAHKEYIYSYCSPQKCMWNILQGTKQPTETAVSFYFMYHLQKFCTVNLTLAQVVTNPLVKRESLHNHHRDHTHFPIPEPQTLQP